MDALIHHVVEDGEDGFFVVGVELFEVLEAAVDHLDEFVVLVEAGFFEDVYVR